MTREQDGGKGIGLGGMAAIASGLGLIGVGVFFLLSFATGDVGLDPEAAAKTCWTGLLGAWIAFAGIHTLGRIPAVILAMLLVFWGLHVTRTRRFFATWPMLAGGILVLAAAALGLCAFADRYDLGHGGLLAIYVSPPALLYFGRWGLLLASIAILIIGGLLAFGEAAVYGTHKILFTIRDMIVGFCGASLRLWELLKMLFTPRLAVAGGGAGSGSGGSGDAGNGFASTAERVFGRFGKKQKAAKTGKAENEAAELEESGEIAVETQDSDSEPAPRKTPIKDWKPRDKFVSRFLELDLRDDSTPPPIGPAELTADAADPVQAAIAPETGIEKKPAADVIMDVDAEAEESDVMAEAAAPVPSPAPVGFTVGAERAEEPLVLDESDPEEEDDEPETVPEQRIAEEAAAAKPPVAPRPTPVAASTPRPAPAARPAGAYGEQKEKPSNAIATDMDNYALPPLELLDPPEPPVVEDRAQIEALAKILEQTLAEFKIEGRVVHVECGPRITLYEISLAPGIRLNKVTSLADNIAMQLQAESIRIIAPIPGKNTIGIEIPNTTKELVSLKEIVSVVNREKRRQALPICLGKDISGSALVADLAKMPHLMIAGATGSGKSVCINSIILSILMCCRPDEAQLIMVDPKVVELSRFKDIPHLMSPVITDMKRAVSVLDWICQKMDERYEQMSQVSVNNIAKFNALGEEGIRTRLDAFASLEDIEAFPKKMPYIVVIIDELADLMMVAGKEVEHHITRLAAKSRAVGIHLILATQRPSVDVITGLIKANMPCRIAFQVASRVDSRTILDQNGADSLLGQGDMLYLPPGVGKLIRAQGVFVSDEELFRVVDFTKAEAEPQYHSDLLGPVIGGGGANVDVSSFDDLFVESGIAIIENQRGSVSLLQRKFGIGYGRASRIIDQLSSVGLLGPFRDGKAREILMEMDEFRTQFGGGSATEWDDGDGSMAGLRDDERERAQVPWDDEEAV